MFQVPFSPPIQLLHGLVKRYGVDTQDPAQALRSPQWRSMLETVGFASSLSNISTRKCYVQARQDMETLTVNSIRLKDYQEFGWRLCNEIFSAQFNLRSALGTRNWAETKAAFFQEAERIASQLGDSEGDVNDQHGMPFVDAVNLSFY